MIYQGHVENGVVVFREPVPCQWDSGTRRGSGAPHPGLLGIVLSGRTGSPSRGISCDGVRGNDGWLAGR
jgi:hypothetical protein